MAKEIYFDRKGRCPICHNAFQSEQCPHSYSYVEEVVREANQQRRGVNFNRDVSRLSRKGKN